ncbi:flagellar motor protein MotB [Thiovibrio frasassiensis]|uniref:OmpA family protein n=1 Tax=Thiovibrio frasassiensis TaxID=2984131 RepID=A0A9X4RM56_9BACT|nr:flagellar motor protein MotB [Thiovibrio frasassiensis]MDG4475985.1 OmpA family protein [Thiovibrio frasassiensis]
MEDKNIIIKKVKKVQGAGAHGGSWKVAFADFMTGMMAFFLLMWLVNMTTKPQKEKLAHYFQEYSLFAEGGAGGGAEIIAKEQVASEAQITVTQAPAATGEAEGEASPAGLEQFKNKLQQEIEQRLADLKDQVHIEVFEGGVKVDIMDKEGNPMFPLGSTALTASGQKILKVLCDNIKSTSSRIEIEGHTDAVSYANKEFGNWELSTARASAARVEVEKNGIPSSRLRRVSGYAATEPIIKDNPFDPRNRRISLRLYPEKKSTPSATQPQPQVPLQTQTPAQISPQIPPQVHPARMK